MTCFSVKSVKDSDLISHSVGEVTTYTDGKITPRGSGYVFIPERGGLYDWIMFGKKDSCLCGFIKIEGHTCPRCRVTVLSEKELFTREGYIKLKCPVVKAFAWKNFADLLSNLGIPCPKDNRQAFLKFIWGTSFEYINGRIELRESETAQDFFKTVGLYGLENLKQQIGDISPYITRIMMVTNPVSRPIQGPSLINGRPMMSWDKATVSYRSVLNFNLKLDDLLSYRYLDSKDRATICYYFDLMITTALTEISVITRTVKESEIREVFQQRIPMTGRANAVSDAKIPLDEVYLPRGLVYHALQTQIIERLEEEGEENPTYLYFSADEKALKVMEELCEKGSSIVVRQPTIHRFNQTSFRIRLWDDERSVVGVNPLVCFTGDTKVKLMDGAFHTFKELSEDYRDKEFWVYSRNPEGDKFIPALAKNPRQTGSVSELIELDFGEHKIKCTPEHRFLLTDGTWVEAQSLIPSMKIASLNFKIGDTGYKLYDKYERFIDEKGNEAFTHRTVGHFKNKNYYSDSLHAHHIDENRLNNSPDNILVLTHKEHINVHNKSEKKKEQVRKGLKKYYTKDKRQEYSNRMTDYNYSEEHSKIVSERNSRMWKDKEYIKRMQKYLNSQSALKKKSNKNTFRWLLKNYPKDNILLEPEKYYELISDRALSWFSTKEEFVELLLNFINEEC